MNNPSVYIIILNWNGFNDTKELLDSLRNINQKNVKILVVDNNSSGNDVKQLETNYKDFIQILKCDSNLGFAGGNNVGIKSSLDQNADFILLLNNDTVVEKGFLEPLINKFNAEDQAGIVAPQINYFSQPKRIWSAGGKISKVRGSGFAISNKLDNEIPQTDRYVDFVSGCCMLIKAQVFKRVGLFDEKFFLYVEDTDLCFRVKKAGYRIFVTPQSKIFHKVNSSTKNDFSVLPLYYTTRNRLYFSKKNFPFYYYLTLLFISLTMLFKGILWFITGQFKNVKAVLNAFTDFFLDRMGKTGYNN